jgi:hypothetical protein
VEGRLYLKLHDDPQVINQATVLKARHRSPIPIATGSS